MLGKSKDHLCLIIVLVYMISIGFRWLLAEISNDHVNLSRRVEKDMAEQVIKTISVIEFNFSTGIWQGGIAISCLLMPFCRALIGRGVEGVFVCCLQQKHIIIGRFESFENYC